MSKQCPTRVKPLEQGTHCTRVQKNKCACMCACLCVCSSGVQLLSSGIPAHLAACPSPEVELADQTKTGQQECKGTRK